MLTLDGRMGEGGGQVLRTSLSLAAGLGVPVRIEHIRGGRGKPGVLRQHRTAAMASAEICGGEVRGAELGSMELEFEPGEVRAGEYRFAVGSAGSAILVLQTILPPLLLTNGESRLVIEGGTHNPWAPPFEAIQRSFARVLAKTGAALDLTLERPGFYPAGGGRVVARIRPPKTAEPLELLERGDERTHSAEVILAHLPRSVGERELARLQRRLHWVTSASPIHRRDDSAGPGNVAHVTLEFEHVTEVLTGFGEKGVSAETVGKRLGSAAARYLGHTAPVGEHLADQLMVPLALLAGGRYRATAFSKHALTNAEVINAFMEGAVELEEEAPRGGTLHVRGRS